MINFVKYTKFYLVLRLCLCLLIIGGPISSIQAIDYVIDPAKSKIKWEGKKVTGSHQGTVQIKEAKLAKRGKSFTGLVIIDMTSLVCTDIEDPNYNKKLIDHLKSDDFFSVKTYPTAKLQILQIKKNKDNKKYTVIGKIQIRGIGKKINFPAKINFSKKKNTFKMTGKLSIDRTKFGLKYNSGKFFKSLGDKLIYDNFTVKFRLISKS